MTAADRRRLVGILGRLASDYDGERAAAGLLASRLLRSAGLTWDDVIPGEASGNNCHSTFATNTWRADLALCRRFPSFLRQWERDFVLSVASQRTLSTKQRAILSDLARGLRERGKL